MAKVVVEAGVCGFVTTIGSAAEGYQLKLTIDTMSVAAFSSGIDCC